MRPEYTFEVVAVICPLSFTARSEIIYSQGATFMSFYASNEQSIRE